MALEALRGWTAQQKNTVAASYLAWALDTFDYFVLVFVLRDVAQEFNVGLPEVAFATTLTLALRPIGAFIFGRLADRYGRKPVLMANIALYSLAGFSTAFAPSVVTFLVIRALFGIAMGGIWGVGASLAMESIKPQARGFVSGLLQSGYPTGYLLASLVFAFAFAALGWRGMFMVGIVPGIFVIAFIYVAVPESPGWNASRHSSVSTFSVIKSHGRLLIYAIFLMAAFNFFAHGTQDLYPTFLQKQHQFDHQTVGTIAIIYNVGAMIGGLIFGSFSQVWGRRRTIIIMVLISMPVSVLWAYAPTAATLAIGAFLMQVCVQAAWGVIPAHLNELSPKGARGTFPGTVYQLGNVIASGNLPLQVAIAESVNDYRIALITIAISSAFFIAIFTYFGKEAREADMTA